VVERRKAKDENVYENEIETPVLKANATLNMHIY